MAVIRFVCVCGPNMFICKWEMRTLKWVWHLVLLHDLPLGPNNIFENVDDILLLSLVLICYNRCIKPTMFTSLLELGLSLEHRWACSRDILNNLRCWIIMSSMWVWGVCFQPVRLGSKAMVVHTEWPRTRQVLWLYQHNLQGCIGCIL